MRMTSIATLIVIGITNVMATPTRTVGEVAPRAFASGSTTCYSKCPSTIDGYANESKYDFTEYFTEHSYHECNYNKGTVRCDYSDDGTLYQQVNTNSCPQQAPVGGCGSTNPDPDNQFKRRSVPRKRTKAERIIQARQYKPKRMDDNP